MCLSKPSMPAPVAPPPPPPPPQAVKQPSQEAMTETAQRNRNPSAMSGGSLLTGPSGVSMAATGKSTLLGQ